MYKYSRFIYWSEEDQRFIVEVPELPGCMADGLSVKDALDNADIIISEWIETARLNGMEVPEPKGKYVYA